MRRLFAFAVASMATLTTCAVPVRSNMGGFLGGHIPQSANIPTVLDYVQDGLVACFDGIENAGIGIHDSASPIWKDLVSNHDIYIKPDSRGIGRTIPIAQILP